VAIHPTAIVEDGAVLGADVELGPYAYVASGARVGDGCRIGPHTTIYGYTTLGAGCRVHAGAVLGDLPQDFGFEDGESFVRIGDRCMIREGVTIHRGSKPGTETVIGNGCMLMAFSHFAHNVELSDNVIVANGALLGGYVSVGARAFISGNVAVHQFVRIGRLVMLGGGAMISKDVPPFCTARPAMENGVGGINVIGMRRAGMSPDDRAATKAAFKILYLSGLNVSQAKEALAERFTSGPGREIHDFVAASERGICGSSLALDG
jgi:UDP-N-acetylglucosamine acyltransferase